MATSVSGDGGEGEGEGRGDRATLVQCPSCGQDTPLICVNCQSHVPQEPKVYVGKAKDVQFINQRVVVSDQFNEDYITAKLKRSREGNVSIEQVHTLQIVQKQTVVVIGDRQGVRVSVAKKQKLLEDVSDDVIVLKPDWPAKEQTCTEVLLTKIISEGRYEFFQRILFEILKEDVPEKVIRSLYDKFRLRLLGLTKGLEVLMEVDADRVADIKKKAKEVWELLSQLLPAEDRDHVKWKDLWNIPVQCQDDAEPPAMSLPTNVIVDDDSTETVNGALSYACQYGNYLTCKNLLAHRNADVTMLGRYGKTLLHIACQYGQSGILDLLLKSGAQVNQPDRDGLGPLHLACERGSADPDIEEGKRHSTVQWLLQSGVDVHLKNPSGMTAEDLARMGSYQSIVHLLQNHN